MFFRRRRHLLTRNSKQWHGRIIHVFTHVYLNKIDIFLHTTNSVLNNKKCNHKCTNVMLDDCCWDLNVGIFSITIATGKNNARMHSCRIFNSWCHSTMSLHLDIFGSFHCSHLRVRLMPVRTWVGFCIVAFFAHYICIWN